jgi:nucleotide-binding universal stress UspA family protein
MPFRITSILAATDLSASAEVVLRAASALAALTQAELHVVNALTEANGVGDRVPVDEDATTHRLRDQLRASVSHTAKVASSCVLPGAAHEVILARADEVCADLIAIGPHRDRSGVRDALGTTADRLIRTSEVPCLIVPQTMHLPLRRVVAATDLSDAATAAVDVAMIWTAALRLPKRSGGGTRLDVVLVRPPGDAAAPAAANDMQRALHDHVSASGERTGCAALVQLDESIIEHDDAAEAILEAAGRRDADLVVMGTHGRAAHDRALIGGTSSSVARRTGCPLLLVPPHAAPRPLPDR